jgi:hypothetical protein
VKHDGLRSTNSFIPFETWKNFLIWRRSIILYQFTSQQKLDEVIIMDITIINFIYILFDILLSKFNPLIDEVIGVNRCGYRRDG